MLSKSNIYRRFRYINSTIKRCIVTLIGLILTIQSATALADLYVHNADGAIVVHDNNAQTGPVTLQDAMRRLDDAGVPYRSGDAQTRQSLGYIVVTRQFPNREAASDLLSGLFDAGERDYLFVNRGVYVNRISAGVFASPAAANKRMQELNRFDFGFEVIERFETTQQKQLTITDKNFTTSQIEQIINQTPPASPVARVDTSEINIPDTQASNDQGFTESEISQGQRNKASSDTPPPPATGSTDEKPTAPLAEQAEQPEPISPDRSEASSNTNLTPATENSLNIDDSQSARDQALQASDLAPANNPTNITKSPLLAPGTENNKQPLDASATIAKNPMKISGARTQVSKQDSSWLWFLFAGIFLIIAGAITYYYLQQRNEHVRGAQKRSNPSNDIEDTAKAKTTGTELNQDSTISESERSSTVDDVENSPANVIQEYAEAVLSGHSEAAGNSRLTIFGSDDTSLTELIQDLLFLKRLDDQQEVIEPLNFDPRSMIDNMIKALSFESGSQKITIQSAPAEDLPASVSMDATKLSRILTIINRYAMSRTDSGMINIVQSFDSGQLTTAVRFHPEGQYPADELAILTNPTKDNQHIEINERVRFGVANRLAVAMGGRIDTSLEMGEATISVRTPASEVQPAQLMLPSGRSIDELIESEQQATRDAQRTREEAEAKIEALNTRASGIEENAERSITALNEELADIEAASKSANEKLKDSESSIDALKVELETAKSERAALETNQVEAQKNAAKELEALNARASDIEENAERSITALNEELADIEAASKSANEKLKDSESSVDALKVELETAKSERAALETNQVEAQKNAAKELEELNAQLQETRVQLEQESESRSSLEQQATLQVSELENQLLTATSAAEQQRKSLLDKEATTQLAISGLREQLSNLRESRTQATEHAVTELQNQLADAESKLQNEAELRQTADIATTDQLATLQNSLSAANDDLASARNEQSRAEQQAQASIRSLEQSKTSAEARLAELEAVNVEANATRQRLEDELSLALQRLEEEKQVRVQAETSSQSKIEQLEQNLVEAGERRDQAVATQVAKIAAANAEILRLEESLEQASEQKPNAHFEGQLKTLQSELTQAQEKLELETSRRSSDESAAGAQISDLLDELNSLRGQTNAARVANEALELEKADAINTLKEQLDDAVNTQKAVSDAQIAQSEEKLNILTEKLAMAEASQEDLASQTQRANAFGEHQTALLQEAIQDAQNANRLGDAARKVTQHLKAKIHRLEAKIEEDTKAHEEQIALSQIRETEIETETETETEAGLNNEESAAIMSSETGVAENDLPKISNALDPKPRRRRKSQTTPLQSEELSVTAESEVDSLDNSNLENEPAFELPETIALEAFDNDAGAPEEIAAEDIDFSLDGYDDDDDDTRNEVDNEFLAQSESAEADDSELNAIELELDKPSDHESKHDSNLEVEDSESIPSESSGSLSFADDRSDQPVEFSLSAEPELDTLTLAEDASSIAMSTAATKDDANRAIFQIDDPLNAPVEEAEEVKEPEKPQIRATNEGPATFSIDEREFPEDAGEPLANADLDTNHALASDKSEANTSLEADIGFESLDVMGTDPSPEPEIEIEIEIEIEPEPEIEPEIEPEPEPIVNPNNASVEVPVLSTAVDIDTSDGTHLQSQEEPSFEFQFDDKPIRSSRPVNNPVLHSMIERFVDRLFEHIDTMEVALANRDYLELVVSCNWVRGEANTLGFELLTTPITSIELQLRREKFSQIITHLSELRNMAERIEVKQSMNTDARVQYFVPEHAKNAVIYENFVSQLGSKILELEVAATGKNIRQMTQVCRWIDRYGTKIKFIEVVDAASQLQKAIDSSDDNMINEHLKRFIDLYAKIEIVKRTD